MTKYMAAAAAAIMVVLAGPVVAEVAPVPVVHQLASVAHADSGDGQGLCSEGWLGYNKTTRTFLADYEQPQKGTPRNQGIWVDNARSGGTFQTSNAATSSVTTSPGNYKTYCVASMWWSKSTAFGAGTDHFKVSFVVYSTGGPDLYRPVAYGSWKGHSYWEAAANGATADFNVQMPWGGYSNYLYATP